MYQEFTFDMRIIAACRRVRIDSQGYAYRGTQYFGIGEPLYYVEFEDGRSGHVRAHCRTDAIATAIHQPRYWGIR